MLLLTENFDSETESDADRTWTTMELLAVVCLCLLTWSGTTFAAGNGPDVTVKVEVGDDAILPCSLSTREDIVEKLFEWKKDGQKEVFLYDAGVHYNNGRTGQDEQFRGRVSHFPDQLQFGNASIDIRNTKVTDSGSYTCDFPRLQTGRLIFNISLIVGAAPKPSIKTLNQTKDWALLQCVVKGASPKPQLQWQDSGGNMVPAKDPQVTDRGGSYDIILQTNVTKTDKYRCVATQEEIHHQTDEDTDIYIHSSSGADRNIPETPTGWIVGPVLGALLGIVGTVVFVLVKKKLKSQRRSPGRPTEEEQLEVPNSSG